MNELVVKVSQQLGVITSNFEEIKAAAQKKADSYKGIIVTEDTVKNSKADIADLRSYQKDINRARIDYKKNFLVPYDEFEKLCNEVVGILEDAIAPMDKQCKEFELKQKEEKKQKALDYFNEKAAGHEELITFDEIYVSEWTNSATSFKSIKSDIDTAIDNRVSDIDTIKAMGSEIEDKAIATYKASKRLADAIKVINDYEKQKADILAKEEARRKADEDRKAIEEAKRKADEDRKIREEEVAKTAISRQAEPISPPHVFSSAVSYSAPISNSGCGFVNAPAPLTNKSEQGFVNQTNTKVVYIVTGTKEDFIQVEAILKNLGISYERKDV
ncbi:MAG: hypothetical protein K0S04_303 [Herbinix sp.]|jgi:hypothetical protein|nr:hypothetical protein [Herbinix sp.]